MQVHDEEGLKISTFLDSVLKVNVIGYMQLPKILTGLGVRLHKFLTGAFHVKNVTMRCNFGTLLTQIGVRTGFHLPWALSKTIGMEKGLEKGCVRDPFLDGQTMLTPANGYFFQVQT